MRMFPVYLWWRPFRLDTSFPQIWIVSQRRVRNIFTHRDVVFSLSFSPDGLCVATCSQDETVRIWRLRDGFSRVLTGDKFDPWSVRFSMDGRSIASGCIIGHILVWKTRTGKLVARWQGHCDEISSLAFTPDDKGLLSASWDDRVILWDVGSLGLLGMSDSLSSDVVKISSLEGHTVRWSLIILPLSHLICPTSSTLEFDKHYFYFAWWEMDCIWLLGLDCQDLEFSWRHIAMYLTLSWNGFVRWFQSCREVSSNWGQFWRSGNLGLFEPVVSACEFDCFDTNHLVN